ncbi:MAG: glutaredoxin domain-containing protein [Candidatus Saccharimonadales bacterium]
MTDTATPSIILYSTTWCGYCKMAKKYLDDKGATFVEKDVEADADAMKEVLKRLDGEFRGVPVIAIGDKTILGFDRPAIDEALRS